MRLGPAPILFDVATWQLGASTTVGDGAAALCGGFVVAGIAWACRFRWLAAVAAIAAASSPALSGHSATATWPTQIALAVHTMCVSYWLGSLWPLHAILRAMPVAEAARIVQRFSAIAVPAVALLGACGIWVAASRIDDLGLAFTSGYGRLLLVKLALALALVAVAAVNRRRVTPSLARGSYAAARTLRRYIAVEIGLGGAVLVVTPPVAGLHGAHSRHDDHSHDDHLRHVAAEKTVAVESRGRVAIFAVAPGRVGQNDESFCRRQSAGAGSCT